MKKTLLLLAMLPLIFFSCGDDDEPEVDPFLGSWELFNASLNVIEEDFEYLEFSDRNNLYGESLYTFEFIADQTYRRILEDVPFTNGSLGNLDDRGDWDLDEDDLDLDVDGTAISGLSYGYTVRTVTASDLQLEFNDTGSAFPQTKINEWFDDGTLDSEGIFTVEGDELDSIVNNFSEPISLVYSLNFDRP